MLRMLFLWLSVFLSLSLSFRSISLLVNHWNVLKKMLLPFYKIRKRLRTAQHKNLFEDVQMNDQLQSVASAKNNIIFTKEKRIASIMFSFFVFFFCFLFRFYILFIWIVPHLKNKSLKISGFWFAFASNWTDETSWFVSVIIFNFIWNKDKKESKWKRTKK